MADVLDDGEIARVLSITAHPDDVDFGAAGPKPGSRSSTAW